ncbi:MAG: hypothetical protein WBV90_14535 [Terrimicrobiaceae bacterium]
MDCRARSLRHLSQVICLQDESAGQFNLALSDYRQKESARDSSYKVPPVKKVE